MMVRIDRIEIINKMIKGFDEIILTYESENDKHFTVLLKTKRSLYYLLNFTILLFSIIAATNIKKFNVDCSCADKLVSCINIINAPYFTRYIMASRILNKKDFNRLKSELEGNDNIKLNFGSTAEHRRNFIKQQIDFNNSIIDIGCGDGFYAIQFSKKLKDKIYYAYDIDEKELEKLSKRVIDNKIDNIEIATTWDNLFNTIDRKDKYDIIITEVIEHMEKNESVKFLINMINETLLIFNKIIITTPNYDFNKNYHLDNKFRHMDHKYELTGEEFKVYIYDVISESNLVENINYNIEFVNVGDIIGGVACSQAVVISKN